MLKYQKLHAELQELIGRINELRERMHIIIQVKKDLLDPEIVAISQKLDLTLNKYHELEATLK